MTSNSFHQRFAKQTSSAVQTSDLSVVWYPGLCNKCHSIHGSSSSNRADCQRERIQLTPTTVLRREKYVESNLLISFHFQLKCRFSRTIILSLSWFEKKKGRYREILLICTWETLTTIQTNQMLNYSQFTWFRDAPQKCDDVRMRFELFHQL